MTAKTGEGSRRLSKLAPLAPLLKQEEKPTERRTALPGKKKKTKKKSARRESEGAMRAIARRNQLLPWSWDHLTPIDLAEIRDLLWELPRSAAQIDQEAAFAIATILTTGRKLSVLIKLRAYDTEQDMKDANASVGLIRNGGSPVWCLNAGSPGSQQSRRPREGRLERYKGEIPIYFQFPLAIVAAERFSTMQASKSGTSSRLIHSDDAALRSAIKRLLEERRAGPVPPRKSSCTVQCLERFLAVAITHQSRGDIGAAARFTDSDDVMSRTVIHYGVTHLRSTIALVQDATSILNRRPHFETREASRDHIGSSRAPSWANVHALINCLKAKLRREHATPHERHSAMTSYTVALLCFALGHRGLGYSLPGSAAVDWTTNFCKVHEKAKDDPSESRMVWVAPVALGQMRSYEEHLSGLQCHLEERAYSELQDQVLTGELPLFTFVDGRIRKVSVQGVWASIIKQLPTRTDQFEFYANSGRHWLRSELVGRCASETVNAFFGHSQSGTDPWSLGSCLDPLIYRADLEHCLPEFLEKAGWLSLNALGQLS